MNRYTYISWLNIIVIVVTMEREVLDENAIYLYSLQLCAATVDTS